MAELTTPPAEAAALDGQLAGLLDAVSYTVVTLDADGHVTYVNAAGRAMVGRDAGELQGRDAERAMPEIFGKVFAALRRAQGLRVAAHFEEYYAPLDLWTELHVCPSPVGVIVCARDVTSRKVAERIAAAQQRVLEMVAAHAPLADCLAAITTLVEQQSTGDLCSILRLDADGRHLHCAAGGSLPPAFSQAIEGLEIGPSVGSCGTAAHSRALVVVTDIATDPRWAPFKELALRHGLRACWSQPILSRTGGRVLGTVANYARRSCEPTQRSLRLLETAAWLAQIAIEQAEAEHKIRRHALAFENLTDGIVLADAGGGVTDWNPAAARMFGYGPAAAPHLPLDVLDAARRDGQWRGEVGFDRQDGGRGTAETTVVPLRDTAGQMTAAVAVSHDVTARKRLECALKAEAAVMRVLATSRDLDEAAPRVLEVIGATCDWQAGALWMVDAASDRLRCRTFWSAKSVDVGRFEAMTRELSLRRGVGLPGRVWATAGAQWVRDTGADANFPRKALAAAAGLHGALGFPVTVNGRLIAVMEFFTRAWREPDQAVDSMVSVIGGEVGHFIGRAEAADALRAANASLEKANRAKDRFFAVLSHELRTPLSPALLVATAMADDPELPVQVRSDGRMIRRNIELQTRLIDDLLDVSRIENGKLTIRSEPVDLHDLLVDCVGICRERAADKRLRVTTDLRARRHVVTGDPARLRQVVCNLLTNAIKFTPAGGDVTVRTADAGARVRIDVIDTGAGASPDMLQKMFDPFEQAGRVAESKGLGLGLTICKGLAEAHGGLIAAISPGPGLGLTVSVELPALATPTPMSQPASAAVAPAGDGPPLRILLVDDHADTLRALSRLLRKLNHSVLTADCLQSALQVAGSNEIDLVISDVGLPDGTGTELMRELLRHGPVRGIAVTGYGSESDVRQTRDAGFSAHLTKPIDFAELQAAIERGRRG